MKRRLMTVTLAVLCAANVANSEVVRVATDPSLPPFEMLGSDGKLIGFDVDLVEAIGSKIKAQIQWVPVGFDAVIPAIRAETVEMGAAGIFVTDDRLRRVAFTEPVAESSIGILIRPEDKGKIRELTDLKNKVVCVQNSSASLTRLLTFPQIQTHRVKKLYDGLNLLNSGVCRAIVGDAPTLGYYKDLSGVNSKNYVLELPAQEKVNQIAIAVNKRNQKLLKRVNRALQEMRDNGELNALYEKWFGL